MWKDHNESSDFYSKITSTLIEHYPIKWWVFLAGSLVINIHYNLLVDAIYFLSLESGYKWFIVIDYTGCILRMIRELRKEDCVMQCFWRELSSTVVATTSQKRLIAY